MSYCSAAVPMMRSSPFRKYYRALETPLFFAWRKLFFCRFMFPKHSVCSPHYKVFYRSKFNHNQCQITLPNTDFKGKVKNWVQLLLLFYNGQKLQFFNNCIETICYHQTIPWTYPKKKNLTLDVGITWIKLLPEQYRCRIPAPDQVNSAQFY